MFCTASVTVLSAAKAVYRQECNHEGGASEKLVHACALFMS
jgi:hypothetical protein